MSASNSERLSEDDLKRRVQQMDPALTASLPTSGSERRQAVFRAAVTDEPHGTSTSVAGSTVPSRRLWVGAAALVVVVASGAGVLQLVGAGKSSSQVVVEESGDSTGSPPPSTAPLVPPSPIESLAGELLEFDSQDVLKTRSRIESSGGAYTVYNTLADESEHSSITRIGQVEYNESSGEPGVVVISDPATSEPLSPFASSMESILGALVLSEPISVVEEPVGAYPARRFDYVLSAASVEALQAMPAGVTAWLQLEYPEEVTHLSVWVSHDSKVVLRAEVETSQGVDSLTFTDFNEVDEISAPEGPYREASDPGAGG